MKDKVIQWLEDNMNKNNLFYYEYDKKIDNIINCYFKENKKHFCVFYANIIKKMIKKELEVD